MPDDKEVDLITLGMDGRFAFSWQDGDDYKVAKWKDGQFTDGSPKSTGTTAVFTGDHSVLRADATRNTTQAEDIVDRALNANGDLALVITVDASVNQTGIVPYHGAIFDTWGHTICPFGQETVNFDSVNSDYVFIHRALLLTDQKLCVRESDLSSSYWQIDEFSPSGISEHMFSDPDTGAYYVWDMYSFSSMSLSGKIGANGVTRSYGSNVDTVKSFIGYPNGQSIKIKESSDGSEPVGSILTLNDNDEFVFSIQEDQKQNYYYYKGAASQGKLEKLFPWQLWDSLVRYGDSPKMISLTNSGKLLLNLENRENKGTEEKPKYEWVPRTFLSDKLHPDSSTDFQRDLKVVSFPEGWDIPFDQYPARCQITEKNLVATTVTKTKNDNGSEIPENQRKKRPGFIFPVDLAVDANRDGIIKFAGNANSTDETIKAAPFDSTSKEKPFRFWVNDDQDDQNDNETYPPVNPDYKNYEINYRRNLEDFSRIWMWLGGLQGAIAQGKVLVGLKWTDVSDSRHQPAINIYEAADVDGNSEYLSDQDAANSQIGGIYDVAISDKNNKKSVDTSGTFIFKPEVWSELSESAPIHHFLFEGASQGKGKLMVVFLNPDGKEIGSGGELWLDIKPVKQMFEIAHALPGNMLAPFDRTTNFNINTASVTSTGGSFEKPYDETKECIIFVHGWNTDEAGFDYVTSTFFKRLWWRGFKGRFSAFRWDTLMGPGLFNSSFNISEWRAYKYGKSLQDYISQLKSRLNEYSINVISHSLGAAVVASALDRSANIDNCIFLQGALPARVFDPDANARAGVFTNTLDFSGDGGYRGWLSPSSVNVVNFYNSTDAALFTWQAYQNAKPADVNGPAYYGYTTAGGSWVSYSGGVMPERRPFDLHESMAFISVSTSAALGADSSAHNVVKRQVNVGGPPFNFGTAHGAEFDRDAQNNVIPFYKEVLDSFDIPFNQ